MAVLPFEDSHVFFAVTASGTQIEQTSRSSTVISRLVVPGCLYFFFLLLGGLLRMLQVVREFFL